jgi:hypothetical protein
MIPQNTALPPSSVMDTTLVAIDIMGYARRYRGASAQLYARQTMYELVIEAFGITALPWRDCYREDRGDGALIVAPPGVAPGQFLDPLIHHLNALLRCHARHVSQSMRLNLRMAVHYGYVYYDAHGVTSHALTHLYRLLEAPAFKKAVAESQLGAIVSDQLYTQALEHHTLIDPAAYTQVYLSCKETRTRAWLWAPLSGSGTQRGGLNTLNFISI